MEWKGMKRKWEKNKKYETFLHFHLIVSLTLEMKLTWIRAIQLNSHRFIRRSTIFRCAKSWNIVKFSFFSSSFLTLLPLRLFSTLSFPFSQKKKVTAWQPDVLDERLNTEKSNDEEKWKIFTVHSVRAKMKIKEKKTGTGTLCQNNVRQTRTEPKLRRKKSENRKCCRKAFHQKRTQKCNHKKIMWIILKLIEGKINFKKTYTSVLNITQWTKTK